MADLIIQNPSITPNVFEYDEAGRVSAISGYPLAGGGGGTIVKSDLMWKPSVESDGCVHWTLASSATTPVPAYISGAQGPAGLQGVSGNPGKNPEFQINPTDAHWQWRYSGDEGWTDLGVVASGTVGPQGLSGNNGKDGISPTVTTATIEGGNRVTFTYGEGSSTYIDVMSGASGANGINGISPTVSTETITGGNRVTFTYDDGGTTKTESIDVMSGASGANGSDGFSPTVTVTNIPADPSDPNHKKGGTEITITDATTTNKFSAWNGNDGTMAGAPDIEGKNGISAVLDGSTYKVGLSDEFYNAVTSVSSTYATKDSLDAYLTKNDAAESYQPKGNYLSANALNGYATEAWVEGKNYLVADDITGKADKTDLQYVSAGVDYVSGHIPTKVTDLTDSANYVVTGNILTGTDNTLTGIKIGSTDYTVPTTDLSNYYTKSQTSANSELDTEFANKVNKPDTTQTVLNNNYLIYSTLTGEGTTTGWMPLSANYYSKSEADGRYQKKSDMGSYLTTAQYETDSATFVTSSNLVITGDAQYALTTSGWEKVQGGVSRVETNNYVSGDGTIQYPIGLSAEAASAIDAMSDQYQIDGGQYVSVVPNSTTHKVVVGLDNQATNAIADVIASANIWDKASAVSTKSHVTIDNTTNIITTENQGTSASLSAVEYKDNVNVAGMNIQQIYAVRNDGDIFACLSTTANKGTLFFVCSGV